MQKGKLRVFFVQNQTNSQLVIKFQTMPRFHSCEFVPLVGADNEIRSQLEQTRGPAALIWGSGEQHDFSYHFTKKRIWLKVNIDRHPDTGLDGLCPDLYKHVPAYADHMKRTKDDGAEIIALTILNRNPRSRLPWLELLTFAKIKAVYYRPGQIGVTVDCDAFPCFPAQEVWVRDTGLYVVEMIDLIRFLGNRIGRLDIGGMLGSIPEFRLIEDAGKPTLEDTLAFVRKFDNIARDPSPEIGQEVIDRVCSYATMTYIRALEAFAQVNGYE